jgi:hypothetical protein
MLVSGNYSNSKTDEASPDLKLQTLGICPKVPGVRTLYEVLPEDT